MIRALLLLAYMKQMLLLIGRHKNALHWHERLARSPVTKLIRYHNGIILALFGKKMLHAI
jgi:hypothetical protein